MKKSTKIVLGILLLVIGFSLVFLPIILFNRIQSFELATIGMFLMFFGFVIIFKTVLPEQSGGSGRDGWDRMRWLFTFLCCFINL